jgi:hypothetical protein
MGRASAPDIKMISDRIKQMMEQTMTEGAKQVSSTTAVPSSGLIFFFVVFGSLLLAFWVFFRSKRRSRSSAEGKWQLTVDEILAVGTELKRCGYEHQVRHVCACTRARLYIVLRFIGVC